MARVAFGGFCRAAQVVGGGEVGEHVVVHDCGVLIRPSHTGDVSDAVKVVVPQRYPQAGRFDKYLQSDLSLQRLVAGH